MNNVELIGAHHVDQVRRGLMPSSIHTRDQHLRLLATWIQDRSLLTATREEIELFLDSRRNAQGLPITHRTRYSWVSHLHGFYEWAIREEIGDRDPTARIIRPKMRRSLPRPAVTAELSIALAKAGPQHRCWLLLAAFQGLRCQEIAGLSREDVLEAEGLLLITHAKGGKERQLALHPDVLAALKELPMPRIGRIFKRPRGGQYSPANLSQEFNVFLECAGVNATAHQLRHWFGTNLYARTHDILLTQEMMGHSNPATTAIYTAFDRVAAGVAIGAMTFEKPAPDPEAA